MQPDLARGRRRAGWRAEISRTFEDAARQMGNVSMAGLIKRSGSIAACVRLCRRSPSLTTPRARRPRGVVDTSVLIAGISGFRTGPIPASNPSGRMLRDWMERATFTWLLSEEILAEYKAILQRLNVRRETIGASSIFFAITQNHCLPASGAGILPTPATTSFARVSKRETPILSLR